MWGNFVPSLMIAIIINLNKWGMEEIKFSEVIIAIQNYLYHWALKHIFALKYRIVLSFSLETNLGYNPKVI